MKSRWRFIHMLWPVGLTLLLYFFSETGPNNEWTKTPAIVLALLCIACPLGVLMYGALQGMSFGSFLRHRPQVLIGEESQAFFFKGLEALADRGGYCFSTYLMERAKADDLVVKWLDAIAKKKVSRKTAVPTVEYERLVMLDDPTEHAKWITNFRRVCREVEGLDLRPKIHHVGVQYRTVVRLIQSVLPRAGIALFKFADESVGSRVLLTIGTLVSYSGEEHVPGVGIAFKSKQVYEKLAKLKDDIVASGNPHLRTLSQEESYEPLVPVDPMPTLTRRLLFEIEEIAIGNDAVEHVGVFGSAALVVGLCVSNGHRSFTGGDLDLIVVVDPSAHQDAIRNEIVRRFKMQSEDLQIEFSNRDGRFYEFRAKYHVDIQLHTRGDQYYRNSSMLLGYSIFGGRYHVIYSRKNSSVDKLLGIPDEPLKLRRRVAVFLKDRLGLEEFIKKCAAGGSEIDPRRVLAISLSNLVWALTGTWPHSVEHCLNCSVLASFSAIDIDEVRTVIEAEIAGAGKQQIAYLAKTREILDKINAALMVQTVGYGWGPGSD